MGIDITIEDLIRLGDVPKLKCLPPGKDGKRIHLSTVYRWALGGTGGVKLETLKVGGSFCTSVEALQRFFDALTTYGVGAGQATPFSTPAVTATRQRQIEAASRRVDDLLNGNRRSNKADSDDLKRRMAEARKNPRFAHMSTTRIRQIVEAERRLEEAGI